MGLTSICYFNASTGIKFVDFIEVETLNAATIQRHDNMRKIAKIYQTVHNSYIRLKNEFNIFREIEKYDIFIQQQAGVEICIGKETVRL